LKRITPNKKNKKKNNTNNISSDMGLVPDPKILHRAQDILI